MPIKDPKKLMAVIMFCATFVTGGLKETKLIDTETGAYLMTGAAFVAGWFLKRPGDPKPETSPK